MLNSVPHTMMVDLIASLTKASFAEKLEVLDAVGTTDRFKKALPLLIRQVKSKFLRASQFVNSLYFDLVYIRRFNCQTNLSW